MEQKKINVLDGQHRYVFVKELKVDEGTFPVNAQIDVINGRIFYNGGMIQPTFYNLFYDLIEYELIKGFNYLREVPIPYNKV